MASAEFGEMNPPLVTQQGKMACLSANGVGLVKLELGLDTTEQAFTSQFIQDGLESMGDAGVEIQPARAFDASFRKFGLAVSEGYPGRVLSEDEEPRIIERLATIDKILRSGKKALLAFPRRREGQVPFQHFVVATGFKETPEGDGVVILDTSEIDGGIKHPTWEELAAEYVRPTEEIPVMAWAVSKATEPRAKFNTHIAEQGLPGMKLLTEPLYKAEDAGKPVPPETDHPISVAMPTSDITKQWAGAGDAALSRDGNHPYGYPRFVQPPAVRELSYEQLGNLKGLPFPSRHAAEISAQVGNKYGSKKVTILERDGLFWLEGTEYDMQAWQYGGLGISSRQATAHLEGRGKNDIQRRTTAEQEITSVIESYTGAQPEDIYLFPTGMAAITWMNQVLWRVSGDAPTAQFGFPYTDTFKQGRFGLEKNVLKNVLDFRDGDYARLEAAVAGGQKLSGVLSEYPSNPLLRTPNIAHLDYVVDGAAPIVLDDTIGTMFNIDYTKLPSSVAACVTSLTKFFSSRGDVMGGSIVLRPDSPHYESLRKALDETYEDMLWHEDAEALAANSGLFPEIMPIINRNGAELAAWLQERQTGTGKPLDAVYHPSLTDTAHYDALKKDAGGYGGLFSVEFTDPQRADRFYNRLRVTKTPGFGMLCTTACFYTLLAHREPDAVKRFGVVPHLIRISAGIEEIDDSKDRLQDAFDASS